MPSEDNVPDLVSSNAKTSVSDPGYDVTTVAPPSPSNPQQQQKGIVAAMSRLYKSSKTKKNVQQPTISTFGVDVDDSVGLSQVPLTV